MADRSLSVRLRAEVDQFRKDMQQASRAVGSVGDAAKAAGQQRTAMQQLGQAAREVGTTVAVISGAAAAGIAALGVQTIRAGIAYNSLEQTSRAALTTLLGSAEAAEEQMDRLREFVETRMFPREAFIQGQQRLLAFGFTAERVIPTLGAVEDAVLSAGGSAAVFGEVVGVLADIQSTGRITATELRELGRRGINAAELIGDAMGKTEGEIRESITSGALDGREAIELLVQSMETRFAGAAGRVADTWVGATGLISAGLRNIGSTAVEAFIDPAGGGAAVQWARDLAGVLQALNRQLRPLVDELSQRAEPAFRAVSEQLQGIAERIDELDLVALVDQVSDGTPAFAALGAGVAAAGSASLLSSVGFRSLGTAISPVGAAVTALAITSPELRAALLELADALAPLLPVVAELATLLATALSSGIAEVAALISPLAEAIGQLVDVFAALPTEVQQATLAIGAFALALRFGGPVGKALAVIATLGAAVETVEGIFRGGRDSADEFRAGAQLLAEDLERFGRTGRIDSGIQQTIDQVEALGDELRRAADPTFWEGFQDEIEGLLFGGPRSPDEVLGDWSDSFAELDQQLAALVASGNAEAAEDAFARLAERAEAAGVPHEVLVELLPMYARELERHGDVTADAADGQDRLARATDRVAESMQEYHDELRAQADPLFALHRAIRQTEDAQTALDEAIAEFGENSPEARDAALDLAEAASELNAAALGASGALTDEFVESMLASLEAAGVSEPAIGLVEDALRGVSAAGEEIADSYETVVRVHGAHSAAAAAIRVRDRLNEIDRFVNTHFTQTGQAPIGSIRLPFAEGGPVAGPAGIDRVPAMLTRGEHVLTVDEVTALGGHQAVASLRAMALAGATRFATGGPVGVPAFQRGGAVGGGAVLVVRGDGSARAEFVVDELARSAALAGGLDNLVRIER